MALKDKGIKILVQVWMSNGNDGAKMKRVSFFGFVFSHFFSSAHAFCYQAGQICVLVVKGPNQSVKEAIDELMARARKHFSAIYPDKSQLDR